MGDSPKKRRQDRRNFLLAFGWEGAKTFLTIDRDARRLLRRARRQAEVSRGRGRPRKGEAAHKPKQEALELLDACRAEGLPPPESLTQVVAQIFDVKSDRRADEPTLSDKQQKALERELKGISPEKTISAIMHGWRPWPGRATLGQVANAAGVSREAIRQWRLDENYQRKFMWAISSRWAEKIGNVDEQATSNEDPEHPKHPANRYVELFREVEKYWTGPVRSPINLKDDGNIFTTPREYALHLLENDLEFAPDSPRVKK